MLFKNKFQIKFDVYTIFSIFTIYPAKLLITSKNMQ